MEPFGPDASSPPERMAFRAAWWAWPVILLATAGIVLAPQLLPQAAEITEIEDYTAEIVTLQLQARFIVAVDTIDPRLARQELKKLEPQATTDGAAAALAILHVFLDPEGDGPRKAGRLLDERMARNEADIEKREKLEKIRRMLREGATETQRESLRLHLGRFVDYLPAPGNPLAWPKAEEIRGSAGKILKVMEKVLVVGGLAFLAGGFLLVMGISMSVRRDGLGAGTPAIEAAAAPPLLEGFAIFMGLFLVAQVAGFILPQFDWIGQAILMMLGILAIFAWPRWGRGLSAGAIRRAIGIHRGRGWLREIGAGFLGYLAVIPLAAAGLAVTLGLVLIVSLLRGSEPGELPSHPIVGLLDGEWSILFLVFVLASVIAPLVEEIAFRGAFFGGLRPRWKFLASGVVTGLIFAVIHPQGLLAVPALAAIGFGLAAIREWRGSLIAPMIAHGLNNGVVFSLALLMLG